MHAISGVAVLPANVVFGVLYRIDARLAFVTSASFAPLACPGGRFSWSRGRAIAGRITA